MKTDKLKIKNDCKAKNNFYDEMLPETESIVDIELYDDIKYKNFILLNKKLTKKEVSKNKKIRERYDKNNIRRKLRRRNENLLNEREQAKVDNIRIVQQMIEKGCKNKDIVELTGLTKGTVSKYSKIDLEVYVQLQIKKANIKNKEF